MIKKIILFTSLFILIITLGVITLFCYEDKNINDDKLLNNKLDIKNNKFYDKVYNGFDYRFLFHYLSFNTEYNDVPVTEHYKTKFKLNLSEVYNFEKYNSALYNYESSDLNQMLTRIEFDYLKENSFSIELLILKKPSDNHPMLNRIIYFNYLVDENGFVDDIEFIKEEIYREDDGTPIIRPNNRKFDAPNNIARYLENLVYGFDFIKYKNEREWIHYGYSIDDIEWEFKEYALTDNLKKSYDINKGLIADELKQWAYKNKEDITLYYPEDIYMDYNKFPKDKKSKIQVKLYYNGMYYDYNLSYSINDDMYLDSISLEKL